MSPLTRHDAQGCAGLALALAWAAAVAWKDRTTTTAGLTNGITGLTNELTNGLTNELTNGLTNELTNEETAQEDRLADAVQAAKSNEENLAALQVELNSAITAMQEALGSVERALGQPQAEIDARAAELRAGAETSIAAIDSAALNAMAYVRERMGPQITDAVPPAFDPLVTSFESVVNARGGSATQAVTVAIPGNEYHAAGTFLDLVIDGGEGTGGITTSEGKYLVLPTNTNWTIIAAISYASPDGWSMLKIINPDSHRSYGNYILAQQEINGSMGLDTASAVVYVDDSTIRIGIKVTNANATSWVRGNNLSRVLLIPSKNPPA